MKYAYMKNKYFLLLVFCSISSPFAFCQNVNVNSILDLVDSTRVEQVMTTTISHFGNEPKISNQLYELDSFGLVTKFTQSDDKGQVEEETKYIYNKESLLLDRTINFNKRYAFAQVPDTIITRYSYNKDNLVTNRVATNQNDSLIYILNIQYNEYKDPIIKQYQRTPAHILRYMPRYVKDSTAYDYKNNMVRGFKVSENGGVIMSSTGPIPKKNRAEESIYDSMNNLIENSNLKIIYKYDTNDNWIYKESYSKRDKGLFLKSRQHRTIKYKV